MTYGFWTQAPPVVHLAHGNHGIAREFALILKGNAQLLLTSRFRRRIKRAEIREATGGIPVVLYPDSTFTGMRRFFPVCAAVLDCFLFAFSFPVLLAKLRRRGIDHLFVLCGADGWFLIPIALMQRFGPPVDVCLVDDMESSAHQSQGRLLKRIVRPLLAKVLHNCDHVWAISEGFCEHLNTEFACHANWLPLPMSQPPPGDRGFSPTDSHARRIVFIGGLNHLYFDALRDLYEEICAINETSGSDFSLYLEIITYGNPKAFCDSLVSSKYIIIHQNMPLAERLDHLRTSFACFLPYSFLPVEKTMVSTSFSCKLIEYYEAGRPILVYGPEYASIPRYFSNAGLPLCATCRPQLRSALRSISEHDTPDLLSRYAEVWKRFHSPQAITDRLFNRI